MASKKQKTRRKSRNDPVKQEEKLQAILLADSFTNTFKPITLQTPKVLIPVVNVPMIEYTLEWLSSNGVQEVLVLCSHLAAQVYDYLWRSGRWNCVTDDGNASDVRPGVPMVPLVKIISDQGITNAGDALRELDRTGAITSDPFVLVSGDVITNIDLKPLIKAFKIRRQKDRSAMMTCIFKRAEQAHPTRQLLDDLVVTLDQSTNQILGYSQARKGLAVEVKRAAFKNHRRISFRHDLLDCGIDICSAQVPLDFDSNYDYKDVHKDYLATEVYNVEVGMKYFAHVVEEEYAARIQDLGTYDAIAKDIMRRWTYPLVPDSNFTGRTTFTFHRNNIFKEGSSKLLDRSVTIGAGTAIGAGTRIGEGSIVNGSIIGRGCQIGRHVTFEGAYLLDGVVVEDNATVTRAVLCDRVRIGEGSKIPAGCVIAYGVAVPPHTTLKPYVRLSSVPPKDTDGFGDSDDDSTDTKTTAAVAAVAPYGGGMSGKDAPSAGHAGCGREWTFAEWCADNEDLLSDSEGDDDMETDEGREARRKQRMKIKRQATFLAAEAIPLIASALTRGRTFERQHNTRKAQAVLEHMGYLSDDDEDSDLDGDAKAGSKNAELSEDNNFNREIRRMISHNGRIEDIAVEIRSYTLAENRFLTDSVLAVMPPILDMIDTSSASASAFLMSANKVFGKWKHLLLKFTYKEQADLIEQSILSAMEDYAIAPDHRVFAQCFTFAVKAVNDAELVSDEVVINWANDRRDDDDCPEKALLKSSGMDAYLESLEEESSSEGGSSDEETGSESDDE